MLLSHFFQKMFQFLGKERRWYVVAGRRRMEGGVQPAAIIITHTRGPPLLSSPRRQHSTYTKHSHSVIQYQGVQGTCIPALQAQLMTSDRQLASTNLNLIRLILRLPPFALLHTSFHSGGWFKFRLTLNLNLNPDLTLSLKILHFEWQSATKAR